MRRPIAAALALAVCAATAGPAAAGPPGGVPPGLAKKGVTPQEWQARKWRKGDRLPADRCRPLDDYGRYGLGSPGEGRRYCVADGEVVRVLIATREVVEAIGAISLLLD